MKTYIVVSGAEEHAAPFRWINFLMLSQTVRHDPLDKGLPGIVYCFMAKQAGPFFLEGTIDDLTFYKMEGKYYVRMKSSLNAKTFYKSKAFERSRESCYRFAVGNQLASRIYRMIEKEKRVYRLFCFLKQQAILLLKEGKNLQEAEEVLTNYLESFGVCAKRQEAKVDENKEVPVVRMAKYSIKPNWREKREKITLLFNDTCLAANSLKTAVYPPCTIQTLYAALPWNL